MFINTFFRRFLFLLISIICSLFLLIYFFHSIFSANTILITCSIHPFDLCLDYPEFWYYFKIIYIIFYILSSLICSNSIYSFLFKKTRTISTTTFTPKDFSLSLFVGYNDSKEKLFIPEQGLYQNILVTGTIGSGKTSSALYPFTKQLLEYKSNIKDKKIGFLILDVKGNYYKKVKEYAKACNRENDLKIIELNGNIKYNPLDKPNLKASVLADRLKTILTLFSKNNSESYWLDKAQSILTESIKLCRLYNDGYVTFSELHKLITVSGYYNSKISILRNKFVSAKFSKEDVHNLLSAMQFFEEEFFNLDSRTSSILKSEITRITSCFISDLDIINTFSPKKDEINFHGFENLIKNGEIVVLNMNIAQYRNLSKIIAAYLKLDFQTEVLCQLSYCKNLTRPVVFISDEYHEYVTDNDADFFSQSREAKCINIVATQSYTSLLNSLNNTYTTKVIVQNLVNKLWFRTDDIFTIEDAQKQIGKIEKEKFSKTISENSNETKFNYITNTLNSHHSSLSESINSYTQNDFIYDTNFFTQELSTFSCLAFLSTGYDILPPQKLNLIPYFSHNNDNIY